MSVLVLLPSTVAPGDRVELLGPAADGSLDTSAGVPAAAFVPRPGFDLESAPLVHNAPSHLDPGGSEVRRVAVRTPPLGHGSHAFAVRVRDGVTGELAAAPGTTARIWIDTDPPAAVAVTPVIAPLTGDRLAFTFTKPEEL